MDQSRRDEIVRRDGFACRACGRRTRGQVHHILDRKQGGSDADANLVTLCGRCHMLVSPISVADLKAYFGVGEAELLARKARVEVAVHSWVLGNARPVAEPSSSLALVNLSAREGAGPAKAYSFAEVRQSHPRAYELWSPEEDQRLSSGYVGGRGIAELAIAFGRKENAVRSRLRRLGFNPGRDNPRQSSGDNPVSPHI